MPTAFSTRCRVGIHYLGALVNKSKAVKLSRFQPPVWNRTHKFPLKNWCCWFFIVPGPFMVHKFLFCKTSCQCLQNRCGTVYENLWLISSETVRKAASVQQQSGILTKLPNFITDAWRSFVVTVRVILRFVVLFIYCTPLLITYPLLCGSKSMRDLWWFVAIRMLQAAGPTLIKLGQWASTRRDLFSKEFCDQLSLLHSRVSAANWRYSVGAIDELFGGKHWRSFIFDIEEEPIGSGCIAQVYRAKMYADAIESYTGIEFEHPASSNVVEVAIKVARKNVRDRIAIDMAILKFLANVAEAIVPGLFFVDLLSSLEQFGIVLQRQVDLRNEARALERFSKNFNPKTTHIVFPKVFAYSKDVIIESFEDGIPITQLIPRNDQETPYDSASLRRQVALTGARALLKMIFVDNFIHGDLHPGNILVRFNDKLRPKSSEQFLLFKWGVLNRINKLAGYQQPRIRITSAAEYGIESELVLLDAGIAIEETPYNLEKLRMVFTAIVEKRGYDVGRLLIEHAPRISCSKTDEFCREIERIVHVARATGNLAKLNISELLSELFSIVSNYHVGLETSFATVVLAVMVLEGLGRSLDPDLDLFQCAYPFLLRKAFTKDGFMF